jgi:hypothetical protein
MRPDRTIKQAATAGIRTVPTERRYAKRIRGNVTLAPADVALAVEMARAERIEHDIRDYAWKKRAA